MKKFVSDKICESMVGAGSLDCCDYTLFTKMKDDTGSSVLPCLIPIDHEYDARSSIVLRNPQTYENRIRVIDKIVDLSNGSKPSEFNYYVSEYYKRKHHVPFYILVGNLSLSNLIVLFEMFDKSIQFEFMKTFAHKQSTNEKDIRSFSLKNNVIRIVRNTIHHHEPIIPFLCKTEYIDFDTKKAAIKMLKTIYEKSRCIEKATIVSSFDFGILKKYSSKKAKKLIEIIDIVDEK